MSNTFRWSDELYHYQVQGAKHGIRRYQNEDGSLTPLGRIHYGVGKAREYITTTIKEKAKNALDKKALKGNKKAIKEQLSKMSDEELKSAINRLLLEKQYTKEIMEASGRNSRIINTVKDILQSSAKNIGEQALDSVLGKYTNKVLKDKMEIDNAVNPRKRQKEKK